MTEILRNPITQTVIGIIGLIIAFITYRLQRNIKDIHCEISEAPLFSIKDDMQGKLKFVFDNKLIKNAHLLILRIVNSGEIPITAEDQKRPITIKIEADKILTADIFETHPDDIDASISTENSYITLAPTLLNPKDSVTIKTVAESYRGGVSVSARIIGANPIKVVRQNSDFSIGKLAITHQRAIIGGVIGLIGIYSLFLGITTFIAPPKITVLSEGVTSADSFLNERFSRVNVDNCVSLLETTTDETEEFSIEHIAFLNGEMIEDRAGTTTVDNVEVPIGQAIAEFYGLPYGQTSILIRSFEFTTPPQSSAIHTIYHNIRYGIGQVSVFLPSKNKTIVYDYKFPIDVEVSTSSESVSCSDK